MNRSSLITSSCGTAPLLSYLRETGVVAAEQPPVTRWVRCCVRCWGTVNLLKLSGDTGSMVGPGVGLRGLFQAAVAVPVTSFLWGSKSRSSTFEQQLYAARRTR
jgi:hypothetical protein